MKEEKDKELLLKDICGRLPYNVFVNINGIKCILQPHDINDLIKCDINIKPYLYPLSNISDKIIDEIYNNAGVYDICIDSPVHIKIGTKFEDLSKIFDIFHKHHIDYQGLIPKGLAIDATGLNIY